ncbi:nuclear transport factor 2 family protein [Niveispirillum sp. KHB5.9]|uniref:nuclear transport factor 2 family protein n=1 Tax=Niveispirillum sp. KHB5.9 TaxID=3400269 RepID=UPI003A84E735
MTDLIAYAPRIVAAAIVGLGLMVLAMQGSPGERVSAMERNRALAAAGLRAWAEGTGSPFDLLTDGARWTITGNSLVAKTYPSKDAFISEVIAPLNARMRERLVPRIRHLYAEGDTVVALFDARGVALDGKPYADSHAWILRFKDGRIVEAHAFFDAVAFDDLWMRVIPPSIN